MSSSSIFRFIACHNEMKILVFLMLVKFITFICNAGNKVYFNEIKIPTNNTMNIYEDQNMCTIRTRNTS